MKRSNAFSSILVLGFVAGCAAGLAAIVERKELSNEEKLELEWLRFDDNMETIFSRSR